MYFLDINVFGFKKRKDLVIIVYIILYERCVGENNN